MPFFSSCSQRKLRAKKAQSTNGDVKGNPNGKQYQVRSTFIRYSAQSLLFLPTEKPVELIRALPLSFSPFLSVDIVITCVSKAHETRTSKSNDRNRNDLLHVDAKTARIDLNVRRISSVFILKH